jgi:hypothetical protein
MLVAEIESANAPMKLHRLDHQCIGAFVSNKMIAVREDRMGQFPVLPIILLVSTLALAGCELVGDIFKAGVWVGAMLVIGIIALVIWMVSKAAS